MGEMNNTVPGDQVLIATPVIETVIMQNAIQTTQKHHAHRVLARQSGGQVHLTEAVGLPAAENKQKNNEEIT